MTVEIEPNSTTAEIARFIGEIAQNSIDTFDNIPEWFNSNIAAMYAAVGDNTAAEFWRNRYLLPILRGNSDPDTWEYCYSSYPSNEEAFDKMFRLITNASLAVPGLAIVSAMLDARVLGKLREFERLKDMLTVEELASYSFEIGELEAFTYRLKSGDTNGAKGVLEGINYLINELQILHPDTVVTHHQLNVPIKVGDVQRAWDMIIEKLCTDFPDKIGELRGPLYDSYPETLLNELSNRYIINSARDGLICHFLKCGNHEKAKQLVLAALAEGDSSIRYAELYNLVNCYGGKNANLVFQDLFADFFKQMHNLEPEILYGVVTTMHNLNNIPQIPRFESTDEEVAIFDLEILLDPDLYSLQGKSAVSMLKYIIEAIISGDDWRDYLSNDHQLSMLKEDCCNNIEVYLQAIGVVVRNLFVLKSGNNDAVEMFAHLCEYIENSVAGIDEDYNPESAYQPLLHAALECGILNDNIELVKKVIETAGGLSEQGQLKNNLIIHAANTITKKN